uniref:Uncharacterized protein n=1 Tax=Anguilla anguilla TaxID=7936 RepID=A0A0E9X663_ANGAN
MHAHYCKLVRTFVCTVYTWCCLHSFMIHCILPLLLPEPSYMVYIPRSGLHMVIFVFYYFYALPLGHYKKLLFVPSFDRQWCFPLSESEATHQQLFPAKQK